MSDDIQRWMGRVETKIDAILEHNVKHEERIVSLENDRNRAKGALWGISVISGGIGAFLSKITGMWN